MKATTHDYRKLAASLVAVLVAATLVAGCKTSEEAAGLPNDGPVPPGASETGQDISGKLTVLVPCGQLGPFMEAKAIFQDKHPGVEVDQQVENINVLRTKILTGKLDDADVFMDMGDTVVGELREADAIIADTECAYSKSYMAVVVPIENKAGIVTFNDLGKPEVEAVAIAKPEENSNGAYAIEALKSAGLWDDLDAAGKIIIVDQPAQLKGLVATKKVDAAFIYGPCVHEAPKGGTTPRQSVKQATVIGNVPEDLYSAFYCTAAVLKSSPNEAAARAFITFLETDECNEIWQKWYFGVPKSKAAAKAQSLLVHCGAGIRPPMEELAELFEKRTGTEVDVAYKGSGCLLSDIEFSHRGDLYMPGEQDYMDQADERGFVTQQYAVAAMETVIITPLDDKHGIESIADLAKPGIRVGMGEAPQVACGVAAEKALEKAGIKDAVLENVTQKALNVVELANSVQLGAIDAAIVWDATAFLVRDDVRVVRIDPEHTTRTVIPFGSLTYSRHPDKAQLFLELVSSAEGQEIFESHGYGEYAG